MKNRKLTLALICALAIACIGGLVGCQNGETAGGLSDADPKDIELSVKGNFDLFYFAEGNAEYQAKWDISAQDATTIYQNTLQAHIENFAAYFDLDLGMIDQQYVDALGALLAEAYAQANYSVGSATLDGDVFIVPVTVRPYDPIVNLNAGFEELVSAWNDACEQKGYEMNSKESEELWAMYLISGLSICMEHGGYLEPAVVDVHVGLQQDGSNGMYDEDMYAVDGLVLYYPVVE